MRHHDRYDGGGHVAASGRFVAPGVAGGCCNGSEPGAVPSGAGAPG